MAFDPTIASQGMKPLFGFVVTERRFSFKFCIKLHISKRIHPEKLLERPNLRQINFRVSFYDRNLLKPIEHTFFRE